MFIKRSAGRELEATGQKKDCEHIIARIRSLAGKLLRHGCEKPSGQVDMYCVRVGSCSVVYSLDDAAAEIHVVKVGHRPDVYR